MHDIISYCETQISKTKCIEICKSNNPAISGGYNTPPLGAELGSRACPGVHTRDSLKRGSIAVVLFLNAELRVVIQINAKILRCVWRNCFIKSHDFLHVFFHIAAGINHFTYTGFLLLII